MKRRLALVPGLVLVVALLLFPDTARGSLSAAPLAASPLGTAFTYQGQLKQSGQPVNGTCDFQFSLFDAVSAGAQIGATQTASGVSLTNGVFTVTLDFGANAFTGDARWLQSAAACPAGSTPTPLSPRQPVTPAPYALALPGLYTLPSGVFAIGPSVVGGYRENSATTAAATIAGGGASGIGGTGGPQQVTGQFGTIGEGTGNLVSGQRGTISGGSSNRAGGYAAVVGGGIINQANGDQGTVGGGQSNLASAPFATVGGGFGNAVAGARSTVGGGDANNAAADWATVGGGLGNSASEGFYATVGGGRGNRASGGVATVGGGQDNTASGDHAMVPGGRDNTALGQWGFAAGRRAKTNHSGAYVWADGNNFDFASAPITCPFLCNPAENTFHVRATNGARFVSAIDGSGIPTAGVLLAQGGGSWTSLSDRAAKAHFAPVDGRAVLERLAALPVETWSYKSQDPAIRHIGPMAQDFAAAFGVGEDDRHITTVDAEGVAFAAIQGLYQVVHEKDAALAAQQAQIGTQQERIGALEAQLAGTRTEQAARVQALEARLAALERAVGH